MNIINKNLKFSWGLTDRKTTTHCIFHHAVAGKSTVEEIHNFHKSRGWAGIAYHFFVDVDGNIYQGRPIGTIGGHTENWNYCSIGVCFQGNFEYEQMSKKQVIAGQRLAEYIRTMFPTIIFSKHSMHGSTACPGKNFPFDDIVSPMVAEPVDTDVEYNNEPSLWAMQACQKAIDKKIVQGDENGIFGWRDPLSLERMLVVLDRIGIL